MLNTGAQPASKTVVKAGSNLNLSTRFTGAPGASTMTHSHVCAVPLSVSTSIAQQAVGDSSQLADKPILGPAAMQPQKRQTTDDSASQADASSAADLNAATHRSSCGVSIATNAANTEGLTGARHRSSDSEIGGVAEANRAGNAVCRAASPPFFFEGDAGEDSLVDFEKVLVASDASEVTVSQCQKSTASCLPEVTSQWQKAVSNPHQEASTVCLGVNAQASSQPQQQQQQLGSSRTAAPRFEAQPNASRGSQAAALCSEERTQGVARAPATLPRPVVQQASGKSLSAQQIGVDSAATAAAAASTQLNKDTVPGQQAGVLDPAVPGNSGSKENEDVGMARVVRRVGGAHSRLDRQTALEPTKPTTSSKVILPENTAFLKAAQRVPVHCLFIVLIMTGSSCLICSMHACAYPRTLLTCSPGPDNTISNEYVQRQLLQCIPVAHVFDQPWRPDCAIFATKFHSFDKMTERLWQVLNSFFCAG